MKVTSLWGEVSLPRTRYRCAHCGSSLTAFADPALDESGCLPEVLARARELALLLPYRPAAGVLERWGVALSKSRLARLGFALEHSELEAGERVLLEWAKEPLVEGRADGRGRSWMVEIDGKLVPTKPDQAASGEATRWREVKSAVLYPLHSPGERYRLCWLGGASEFGPLVHGLLRSAGVTQQDRLVGLSDGAGWIGELMDDLGVRPHILDVFHAGQYLDALMVSLGWPEAERCQTRAALCRGEIDLQTWLNHHTGGQAGQGLAEEGRKALAYLEKQAQMDHTTYPKFKAQGLVIGSGQVEGNNKAVVGARLNVSGARWSEAGAKGKAFSRGEMHSRRRLVPFDELRQVAFPRAA